MKLGEERNTGRGWHKPGTPLLFATVIVVFASLFGPLAVSGLWDPYELDVADYSRRIAATIFGGDVLRLAGADNTVPILSELGRGELPFTSVAIGFRLFGLHDWAGRLPLALWGLAGISCTYSLVRRLAGAQAAAFAALVLATTPLYFLQARTILGDVVTMAAMAMAVCGLGLLLFGEVTSRSARAGLFLLAVTGIVAGFTSRGLALGVGVPLLGSGLGWWLHREEANLRGWRRALGVGCSLLGVSALGVGLWAVFHANADRYSELAGTAVHLSRKFPTFDGMIRVLGHGMFPWSALIPVALGMAMAKPEPSGEGGDGSNSGVAEGALRIVLLATMLLGFGVQTVTLARLGEMSFATLPLLAALVGISCRDLSKPGAHSLTALVVSATGAMVLILDMKAEPGRLMAGFTLPELKFPSDLEERGTKIVVYASLVALGVCLIALVESDERARRRFDKAEFSAVPKWFLATIKERFGCAKRACSEALASLRATRGMARAVQAVTLMWRTGGLLVSLAWAGSVALGGLVATAAAWGGLLVRDLTRSFFLLPIRRSTLAVSSFSALGLFLSLWLYPAVAAEISPKAVFETFRTHSSPQDELALMGAKAGGARYYVGTQVPSFSSPADGLKWMLAAKAPARRWLVVRGQDLSRMNSEYRKQANPVRNLPIADARSTEVLLAVNELPAGAKNQNPLEAWVLKETPAAQHPMEVNFNDQLRCVGWSLQDMQGNVVPEITRGKDYKFALYYQVTARIGGNWQAFLHLDLKSQRYNGDHELVRGKYSLRDWHVGDTIVDEHTINLPSTLPAGRYTAYFGLYAGSKRLAVKSGPHTDDRVDGGQFIVR